VIADLIRTEIEGLIDQRRWQRTVASEGRGRKLIASAAENWTKVEKMLERRR